MAITYAEVLDQLVINRAAGVGGSGDYTSNTTSSTTSGRLLVLTVSIDTQAGGLAAADVPTPASTGVTWQKAAEAFCTHTDGSAHVQVWLGTAPGGTIDVSQNGAATNWDSFVNGLAVHVNQVAGAADATTIIGAINRVQNVNNHSGSGRNIGAGTITLPSAPASTSIVHHAAAGDLGVQSAASSPAGYTELQDVQASNPGLHCSVAVRDLGSTSTSVAWTDFDAGAGVDTFDYASVAFEIPEAGSGITGTVAVTLAAFTPAASGTTTAPVVAVELRPVITSGLRLG